jgi:ketosteroid isomerase-like protein
MMQPDLHFCRGEYEDARRLYREKVDFWASHPACPPLVDLARLETCLAAAEARMGHLAEAVEMYSRAEATLRTEFCESHPKTVAVRAARAVVMHQMEQAG